MRAIDQVCFAIVLPSMAALGCASGEFDEGSEPIAMSEQNVVSTNRLSMNRLSMNRLSMNSLSATRISHDGLTFAATDLLLDSDGRELLKYIVRCALPEGHSLVGSDGTTSYTFLGLIGLAPTWLTEPLSEKSQRWISACLLAHVNGYGIEVPISLRGDNAALSLASNERSAYVAQEVSFFGNVFMNMETSDEIGDIGPRMYACGGPDLQTACGGSPSTFRPMRSCSDAADCGIKFIGACKDLNADASVCSKEIPDGFTKCYTVPKDSSGKWPKKPMYKEVITVYLSNPDFSSLYPSCAP